ncbi:hypothetical protein EMCRGX_G018192 [Ephydatia muelleri]
MSEGVWSFLRSKLLKHRAGTIEVFHRCDACFAAIKDGDRRHNCDECQESYDLCDKCYSEGKGAEHKAQHGVSHDFTLERYSNMALRDRIPDERIETCFRNAFRYFSHRPAFGSW